MTNKPTHTIGVGPHLEPCRSDRDFTLVDPLNYGELLELGMRVERIQNGYVVQIAFCHGDRWKNYYIPTMAELPGVVVGALAARQIRQEGINDPSQSTRG